MYSRVHPIFVLFSCFVMCKQKRTTEKPTIKAVVMLTRHGDRSPASGYPKDPYGDYEWPGGYGALSRKGAQQMFKSGIAKALRYESLLLYEDSIISLSNLYVRSSSVQRCIDSTHHFLDGFLPSSWPENKVHVVPRSEDELLAIPGKACPKYMPTLYNAYRLDQPEVDAIKKSMKDWNSFVDFLEKCTGLNITSLGPLFVLDDILSIQLDNGFKLPLWTEGIYEPYIKCFAQITFKQMGTCKYMEVRSGALLKDMLNRLDAFIIGGPQNIIIYSAHDLTMSALMYHLDIIDQADPRPAYGSMLVIELHENCKFEDDYEVKVFYFRDYSDDNPKEVNFPGCKKPLSFRDFKNASKVKFTEDYVEACQLNSKIFSFFTKIS